MNLSEYIQGLQLLLKEEGDLECYYCVDDEGNGYDDVKFNGTVMYIDAEGEFFPVDEKELDELKELGCEPSGYIRKVVVVN